MRLNERRLRRSRTLEPSKSAGQPSGRPGAPLQKVAPLRSGSLQGLPGGPKRRTLKRVNRPDLEVSLVELSQHVERSALLDKREPRELSRPHIDRRDGEYLPSSAFNAKLRRSTVLKPAVLEHVVLSRYASDRQSLLVRCVPDSLLKCPDEDLRSRLNKAVFNEDNDTDDSAKLRGVNRNFAALKSGLRSLRLEKRRDLRWKSALPPPYGAYLARQDAQADSEEITHQAVKKWKGYREDLPLPEPKEDSPSLDGELQVLGKGKPKSSLDDLDLEQLVEFDSVEKEKEASSSNRSKSNSMQEEQQSPKQPSRDMEEERAVSKLAAQDQPREPRGRSSSAQKKVKLF